MNDNNFKKTQKPSSCTSSPIYSLIPSKMRKEVLRQIKNECIDIYGQDINSECNKRLVCHSKQCIGRTLPWKSPTALPYLKEFAKNVGIKEGEEYFIKTDCTGCPIFNSCNKPCGQVVDYVNRHKTIEPNLVFKQNIDSYADLYEWDSEPREKEELTIPWDALPPKKVEVIKEYIYNQRDLKAIADNLKLNNQARVRYILYSSLTTLSEYAIVRKFLQEHSDKLTTKQLLIFTEVYVKNKSITQVAKELGVTKQSVAQTVSRVIKGFNIKWTVFAKKSGKRIIYNIPELIK